MYYNSGKARRKEYPKLEKLLWKWIYLQMLKWLILRYNQPRKIEKSICTDIFLENPRIVLNLQIYLFLFSKRKILLQGFLMWFICIVFVFA